VVLDKYENAKLVLVDEPELYVNLIAEAILAAKIKGECKIFLSRRYTKKATNEIIESRLAETLSEKHIKPTISTKMHYRMGGLQLVDFAAYAVYAKVQHQNDEFYQIIAKNDKTLVAFAERHPVPMRQGDYLSCDKYSKPQSKSQALDKEPTDA
jgi:3-hydroxyacyl-CoA dehydrogenase